MKMMPLTLSLALCAASVAGALAAEAPQAGAAEAAAAAAAGGLSVTNDNIQELIKNSRISVVGRKSDGAGAPQAKAAQPPMALSTAKERRAARSRPVQRFTLEISGVCDYNRLIVPSWCPRKVNPLGNDVGDVCPAPYAIAGTCKEIRDPGLGSMVGRVYYSADSGDAVGEIRIGETVIKAIRARRGDLVAIKLLSGRSPRQAIFTPADGDTVADCAPDPRVDAKIPPEEAVDAIAGTCEEISDPAGSAVGRIYTEADNVAAGRVSGGIYKEIRVHQDDIVEIKLFNNVLWSPGQVAFALTGADVIEDCLPDPFGNAKVLPPEEAAKCAQFPQFGVNYAVAPGQTRAIAFKADRAGQYKYYDGYNRSGYGILTVEP